MHKKSSSMSENRGEYKNYGVGGGGVTASSDSSSSSSSSNRNRRFVSDSLHQEPVQVGKEYEGVITQISRQGDGVTRVQGFVVFVKNAKTGQKVKVKVEKVGNRHATATMAS
jgi:predicted RNA-binding protein with TRAM domain